MFRTCAMLGVLAGLVAGCGGEESAGGSFDKVDGIAGLRDCLEDAGAKIATAPDELEFVGDGIPSTGSAGQLLDGTGTSSFYDGDRPKAWIVYTAGGDSFSADLAKPDRPGLVVAYVKPVDDATVKAADDCLDGVLGDDA